MINVIISSFVLYYINININTEYIKYCLLRNE
uniref:Uncharacterized protein n=1 Tax=viral metagenome TaxID=1070528 RepID=A0A6C0HVF3_9ZZZZ